MNCTHMDVAVYLLDDGEYAGPTVLVVRVHWEVPVARPVHAKREVRRFPNSRWLACETRNQILATQFPSLHYIPVGAIHLVGLATSSCLLKAAAVKVLVNPHLYSG